MFRDSPPSQAPYNSLTIEAATDEGYYVTARQPECYFAGILFAGAPSDCMAYVKAAIRKHGEAA